MTDEAMNGLEEFDQEMQGPPQTEEHVFFATLSKDNKIFKFEGCDDAESSLILRRATLDAECTDESRHVIQVITLDHEDTRVVGTLCSLKLNGSCSVSLDGISVAPPTAFKLLKGDGPITLCGNLMKEVDPELLPDMEEVDSDEEAEEEVEESGESEEEEASEEADISKEEVNAKIEELKRKAPAASGDAAPAKKAKQADKIPAKVESASKKGPKKFETVDELVAAVQAHKGGRPKKKEKFENWIKHTFKVDNKKWASEAWNKLN